MSCSRRRHLVARGRRESPIFYSANRFVCTGDTPPPSDLRTHALDSHVAKLGVLLTLLVSRLPLRVIPPFLQLVHVLELNDDQASPRRFTGERNGLATREEASASLCGSLLGDGRDHFHVVVLIVDLIIGDDIGRRPLLCINRVNAECSDGNAGQQCRSCCPRCFHRSPPLVTARPVRSQLFHDTKTGRRVRVKSRNSVLPRSLSHPANDHPASGMTKSRLHPHFRSAALRPSR